MHSGYDPIFNERVAHFLGPYYFALAVMNGLAALLLWLYWKRSFQAAVWVAVAAVFTIFAAIAWGGQIQFLGIPQVVQDAINSLLTGSKGAVIYTLGTSALLVVLFFGRRFFVQPPVAWAMLNLALLLMGLSMVSRPFWSIV